MPVTLSEPQTLDQSLLDSLFGAAAPAPVAVPAVVIPLAATEPVPVTATPETADKATETADTQGRFMSADQVADQAFSADKPALVPDKPATLPAVEPITPAAEPAADQTEEDYTRQIFKATAANLIKKGKWEDVQDFDALEFDQDTFEDFTNFQVEQKLESRWQQVKQSDSVVEGILSVIESGGNPDSIIDLFKEHQAVKQIDTSTTEGKLQMIDRFNQEVVKLNPQQAKAKLKRLETAAEEDIQAEFDIANDRYNQYFTEQQAAIKQTETDRVAAETARKNQQVAATQQALKQQNIHQKTADKLLGDIYQNRWQLPDGEVLSELDYRLLQIRQDPAKNLELARFILDRDGYVKSLTQTATNKVVDDTFQKLTFKPAKTASSTTAAPVAADTAALKDIYRGLV